MDLKRFAAISAVLILPSCRMGVLDPQGAVGHAERSILIDCLVIMLAIVVPVILATFAFAWWFRASNDRAVHLPEWDFSGRIEMIVWAVPLLVITLLGGVAWIGAHTLDPAQPLVSKEPALEVEAISLDWKWLFIYPAQHVAAVNELAIPAGVPVHFSLTSGSVMNAFFIPQLGSMIYTMNGMTTKLNLEADRSGVFYGQSSHFSGDGFSGMHFTVQAMPPAQFARWIDTTRAAHKRLDAPEYLSLAKPSLNVAPYAYGVVEPGLFEAIATQKLAPGPGSGVDPQNPGLAAKRKQ